MKFIRQFLIIILISFAGELLHAILPLPVPASIYGLLILLAGLQTKVIPLKAVDMTDQPYNDKGKGIMIGGTVEQGTDPIREKE